MKRLFFSIFLIFTFFFFVASEIKAAGTFYVRNFGAKGDGQTNDKEAIQAAIDAASNAGGGDVIFDGGRTYISGDLILKSNINFVIQSGATLKASNYYADYTNIDYDETTLYSVGPLIHADMASNIHIKGGGRIEGAGDSFKCPNGQDCKESGCGEYGPVLIWLGDVSGGSVTNVWLGGAIVPAIVIAECDNLTVDGVTVRNMTSHQCNDAIDIFGSQDVTISNNDLESSDDAIALIIRSPWGGDMSNFNWEPTRNITIESNKVNTAIGGSGYNGEFMNISWWVLGEISHVYWKNNIIKSGHSPYAFAIIQREDGVDPEKTAIHDIYYENNRMENGSAVNYVSINYPKFDCQFYDIFWNGNHVGPSGDNKYPFVLTAAECGGETPTPIPTPTPGPNSVYYENEFLRIWDTRVFEGIIDLFAKMSDGSWWQYNNIVPIAKVGGVWANAELDQAQISRQVISDQGGVLEVKYQFSPLSNGAHFYLIMKLENGRKDVEFQVFLNEDSASVEALALGNYYGLADVVRLVSVNGQLEDALDYPRPAGGYRELGDFYELDKPVDRIVRFTGESNLVQKQFVDASLQDQDVLMVEVRYTPWLPEQYHPNKNWFETVHITREPFSTDKSVWHFGYEERISGDINIDSDVDIFDYNSLLENFGYQDCGNIADIDGDCDVDIFDYNALLGNFGAVQ